MTTQTQTATKKTIGLRVDTETWVEGIVEDVDYGYEHGEDRYIVDENGIRHTVFGRSVNTTSGERDKHGNEIYGQHMVACIIDDERTIRTVFGVTVYENGAIKNVWKPFDLCSMRRGENGELLDVEIFDHHYTF